MAYRLRGFGLWQLALSLWAYGEGTGYCGDKNRLDEKYTLMCLLYTAQETEISHLITKLFSQNTLNHASINGLIH